MGLKPLSFVSSAHKDLKEFPEAVQKEVGTALQKVQWGGVPVGAKPMKGFAGVSVMEIVERYDTDTYRAVYTARLEGVVYVLHCFQKKSKRGIATPKPDMKTIERRMKEAREIHRQWLRERS